MFFPVASILANNDNLEYDAPFFDWYNQPNTSIPYLEIANAAFFSDPPTTGGLGAQDGCGNVPAGPFQRPYESLIEPNLDVQGAPGGGALLVDSGVNLVYLAIPCYWGGPLPAYQYFYSHMHFEVRVEAADSVGPLPSGLEYVSQAGFRQLTNAALDVFAALYDDPNNPVYSQPGNYGQPGYSYTPQPGVPDTVINLTKGPQGMLMWKVTVPPGIPSTGDAFNGPAATGYLLIVPVILPQKVANILRVGVYASIYATPEDAQYSGSGPGRTIEFPDPSYYYNSVWHLDPTSNPAPATQPGRDLEIAAINGFNLPPNALVTDQLGASSDASAFQQVLGTVMNEPEDEHLWDYSPEFPVVRMPDTVQPYRFLPYGIIYNPPGNQSAIAVTSQASYSTVMSLSTSQTTQTQAANVQGASFTFGPSATFHGARLGTQATVASESTSVITTSDATANTTSLAQGQVVGIGVGSCSADCTSDSPQAGGSGARWGSYWPLDPSEAGDNVGSPWNQAFWYDQIAVLPSPIIATWSAPPVGNNSPPLSAAQLVGFATEGQPNPLYYQVFELYCAVRSQSSLWDMNGNLQLTWQDCAELDPFFAGGMWQGVQLDQFDTNRFIRLYSFSELFAGKAGTFCISATAGVTVQGTTVNLHNVQNSSSSATSVNISAGSVGGTYNSSQTEQAGITVTYQVQQASTLAQTITSCGVLEDDSMVGNGTKKNPEYPGGFPGNLLLYYDLLFDAFCIQDTNEPPMSVFALDLEWPPFCPPNPNFAPHYPVSQAFETLQRLLGEIRPQAPSYAEPTLYPPPLRTEPPQFPILGAPPIHRPPQMLPGPPPFGPLPPSLAPPINRRPPMVPESPADGLPPSALPPINPQPPVPRGPGP